MKKLKFYTWFFAERHNPGDVINNWVIKHKETITSYRIVTAYPQIEDGGRSIGDNAVLAYTTKNNEPIK